MMILMKRAVDLAIISLQRIKVTVHQRAILSYKCSSIPVAKLVFVLIFMVRVRYSLLFRLSMKPMCLFRPRILKKYMVY